MKGWRVPQKLDYRGDGTLTNGRFVSDPKFSHFELHL